MQENPFAYLGWCGLTKRINLIDPGRAADIAERVALDLTDPDSQQFFAKKVARWLRRRADCMVIFSPQRKSSSWAIEAVRKGHPVHRFKLSQSAARDLERLHAWILAVEQDLTKPSHLGAEAGRVLNGLSSMSVEDALKKAEAWRHADRVRQNNAPPRGPHGYKTKPLYSFTAKDGYVWEKLPAPDIAFLGYDLLNCLRNGTYHRDVAMRHVSIWGLRAPKSGRFVVALTTQSLSHRILAVRGFRNSRPLLYKPQIRELIDHLKCPESKAPDLRAIGL